MDRHNDLQAAVFMFSQVDPHYDPQTAAIGQLGTIQIDLWQLIGMTSYNNSICPITYIPGWNDGRHCPGAKVYHASLGPVILPSPVSTVTNVFS